MKKNYNKLVRDRVPEIIQKSGNESKTVILSEEEYQVALREKILEEATEVATASPEELVKEIADLYEVIDTVIATNHLNKETIFQEQEKRKKERGGFEKKIKLISTVIKNEMQ